MKNSKRYVLRNWSTAPNRQTDRQTNTQTDRQTHTHTQADTQAGDIAIMSLHRSPETIFSLDSGPGPDPNPFFPSGAAAGISPPADENTPTISFTNSISGSRSILI